MAPHNRVLQSGNNVPVSPRYANRKPERRLRHKEQIFVSAHKLTEEAARTTRTSFLKESLQLLPSASPHAVYDRRGPLQVVIWATWPCALRVSRIAFIHNLSLCVCAPGQILPLFA